MFKIIFMFLVLGLPPVLMAQVTVTTDLPASVLNLYVMMLVFATLINRLLEIIKAILDWLTEKRLELRLSSLVLNRVIGLFKRWKLNYDREVLSRNVEALVNRVFYHTLGFAIGLVFAIFFRIDLLQAIGLISLPAGLNFVVSGLLMTLGMDPIHQVIRWAQEKQAVKQLRAAK